MNIRTSLCVMVASFTAIEREPFFRNISLKNNWPAEKQEMPECGTSLMRELTNPLCEVAGFANTSQES